MELKLGDISNYVVERYGIDLKDDKLNKLKGLITSNIDISKFQNIETLFKFMDKHQEIRERIIAEIVVHETHFFRNVHQFLQLRDYILPNLIRKNKKIKILSLGCSTGEEPYSIAMIVDYYFKGFKRDISIVAVDLSAKAIEKAISGIYKKYSFKDYAEFEELEKFYIKKEKERYILSDDIKSMVQFIKGNVFDFLKYTRETYHLIFCRNLIIYFNEKTMKRFLDLVLDRLDKSGFYIAGHSEILEKIHDGFQIIFLGETFIYKKRSIYKPNLIEERVGKSLNRFVKENVPKSSKKEGKPVKVERVNKEIDLLSVKESIFRSLEEENYKEVADLCREYLAKKKEEDIGIILAYALMNLEEFNESITILKGIKGMNSVLKYHIIKGINYYFLLQFNRAIKSFKNALFICDSSIYAYYYLGLIYEQLQNYDMAKKYFKKAISNRLDDNCIYDMERMDRNLKIELGEFVKIANEKVKKIEMLMKE